MNRSSFIKSIAMLIAAPKIVGELQVLRQEKPKTFISGYIKTAFCFKISKEMEEDTEYTQWLFNNKSSFLWKKAEESGMDLSQPFDIAIGEERNDFAMNLRTCIVSQRKPKVVNARLRLPINPSRRDNRCTF